MPRERTQLNINIDPALLLKLKSEAIKQGKTLTDFVVEQLKYSPATVSDDSLIDSPPTMLITKLFGVDAN